MDNNVRENLKKALVIAEDFRAAVGEFFEDATVYITTKDNGYVSIDVRAENSLYGVKKKIDGAGYEFTEKSDFNV